MALVAEQDLNCWYDLQIGNAKNGRKKVGLALYSDAYSVPHGQRTPRQARSASSQIGEGEFSELHAKGQKRVLHVL